MAYSITDLVIAFIGAGLAINVLVIFVKLIGRGISMDGGKTSVVFMKKPVLETPVQTHTAPAHVNDIKDLGDKMIELDVKTFVGDCRLAVYWGVIIKEFPWNSPEPPHHDKEEHFLEHIGSHRIRLSVKDCELGDQPRTHYHLVTVIYSPECESKLYSIYHLYGCSLKMSLLTQYLKLATGEMSVVRRIFNESRCVICLDAPATHMLLPCRHSCVCNVCMSHAQDLCPICRNRVQSFIVAP